MYKITKLAYAGRGSSPVLSAGVGVTGLAVDVPIEDVMAIERNKQTISITTSI